MPDLTPPLRRDPRRMAILLLGFLLGSVIPALGDVVVKKDGESIRGRVIKADNLEVHIEVGGILLRLNRDQVVEIQYDRENPELIEASLEIRRLTEQKRIFGEGEALDLLVSLASMPVAFTDPTALDAARRVAEEGVQRLNHALDALGDFAFVLRAAERLEDSVLHPFWEAVYPGAIPALHFRLEVLRLRGAAHLMRGRRSIEGAERDLRAARGDFARATALLGRRPELGDAYTSLFHYRWAIYWQLRTIKEQFETLPASDREALRDSVRGALEPLLAEARVQDPGLGRPPVPVNVDLFENLNYIENWLRDNRMAFAVETPVVATPPPTPASIWTPIPTETPEPPPASPAGVVQETFFTFKQEGFAKAWENLKAGLGGFAAYLVWGLYALGALIVWIVPPRLILRFRERRGDIEAARHRAWPMIAGPFALLAYLFTLLKSRPKRAKHKCPFCNHSLDDIESYGDMNFIACPNCHQTITPVYDLEDYIEYLVDAVKRELEMSKMGAVNLKAVIEKDAMSKLVRAVLTLAVRRRASDLHVEPESDGVKIRARIDGMLQELTSMPKVMASPLVSALKVMGNLDIAERRVPQDGRFQIWVDKADIDIRIASAPGSQGEKCTLRFLDSRSITVDASRLGMEPDVRAVFEKTIHMPHGMMLVTGPTGSGKSTTLYVALQRINTGEKNIISIEDPVEFKIKGVNQMQVNNVANFTFATGLRSVLRQDPDVIMIGEIRDRETADISIEAAMTGHLLLSTLHTIDSVSAIGRLVDLGVEPRRFADALQLVLAQRLLRLNCRECAKPYKPKPAEFEAVGLTEADLAEGDEATFLKSVGCDVCRLTGFFGRLGLFEALVPKDDIRELIETKANTNKIRQAARNQGMQSLREQGLDRARQGLTTLEEVLRVTA